MSTTENTTWHDRHTLKQVLPGTGVVDITYFDSFASCDEWVKEPYPIVGYGWYVDRSGDHAIEPLLVHTAGLSIDPLDMILEELREGENVSQVSWTIRPGQAS